MRMLYVEDNRINALLFEEAMRLQPVEVELRIAETGAEALAMAGDWTPDVLVLDAHLPDTDGLTLLTRLRTVSGLADVPAYMCSADTLDTDIAQSMAAGIEGYWTKPVDFAIVLADLRRLEDRRRGR